MFGPAQPASGSSAPDVTNTYDVSISDPEVDLSDPKAEVPAPEGEVTPGQDIASCTQRGRELA